MALTLGDMDGYTLGELDNFTLAELDTMSPETLAFAVIGMSKDIAESCADEIPISESYQRIVINVINVMPAERKPSPFRSITAIVAAFVFDQFADWCLTLAYEKHEQIFELLKEAAKALWHILHD